MSRRHAAEKREVLPDAKYGDLVLTKFMNNLMIDGKKSVAERIVYSALERVEGRLKRSPIEVFTEALENVKPSVEVRSRRVGTRLSVDLEMLVAIGHGKLFFRRAAVGIQAGRDINGHHQAIVNARIDVTDGRFGQAAGGASTRAPGGSAGEPAPASRWQRTRQPGR